MHGNIINDNVIEKILCTGLCIEDSDKENAHKFLCLLKRRTETQLKNNKEIIEEKFRTVLKNIKK